MDTDSMRELDLTADVPFIKAQGDTYPLGFSLIVDQCALIEAHSYFRSPRLIKWAQLWESFI